MHDFKVGGRVEYVGTVFAERKGKHGVVAGIVDSSASVRVEFDGDGHDVGCWPKSLRLITPAPGVITISCAEDATVVALDALELHGVPPTDTGGWRTAMEQSFQSTSDNDLAYTAWLHLKALSLRAARVASENEAKTKLIKRRDELARELYQSAHGFRDNYVNYDNRERMVRTAIDRIIELEDARG